MSEPKIEADDQWKEQAEREKARLAGEPKEGAGEPAKAEPAPAAPPKPEPPKASSSRPALPPASFAVMVEEFATQILFSLGAMPHPATGKTMKDLELAKHYIGMLEVLEAKTKGNLTAGEERMLSSVLYEMRMAYVNAAKG